MLAATFTRIAMVSQTNQLDSGPVVNKKLLVHPKFEAKLQAASAYPEKTAGPIKAATRAPNSWAVPVAQAPAREKIVLLACNRPAARCVSVLIAIAVVRGSGIFSAFANFDARHWPKVPGPKISGFRRVLPVLDRSRHYGNW